MTADGEGCGTVVVSRQSHDVVRVLLVVDGVEHVIGNLPASISHLELQDVISSSYRAVITMRSGLPDVPKSRKRYEAHRKLRLRTFAPHRDIRGVRVKIRVPVLGQRASAMLGVMLTDMAYLTPDKV